MVDLVGGPTLVSAFRALRPHGVLVAVGHSSGEGETFDFGDLFGNGGRHDRSLATFYLADTEPAATDLTWLAERVARGELHAPIAWRAGWDEVGDAVAALLGRRLHGKAVIELA